MKGHCIMQTKTATSSTFDLTGLKRGRNCRYWVQVEIGFSWQHVSSFEGAPVGRTLDEVLAVAEKLVYPKHFDPKAEYAPRRVRITRVGRFLDVPVGEYSSSVDVMPLQVFTLVTGSPDTSPAGNRPDPIPMGKQAWLPATYLHDAYSPARLVEVAEQDCRYGHAHAARIVRAVGLTQYEVWSITA